MAKYRKYISYRYVFISSLVSLTKYAGRKLNSLMWLRMAGEFMSTYFLRTVIWIMTHLLTTDNRPGFQWNVDTYTFVYLLRSNQYVSNQYILDRNPRLSYYTIGVTYSDYISILLVCGDCPLTSKMGGCWNLLGSTPARIPLINPIHKCTRILFIISNTKLGIWICSQPRIDLNSQSNFYDDLTIPYKDLSNTIYKTTCTQDNLHVSFTIVYVVINPLPPSLSPNWYL